MLCAICYSSIIYSFKFVFDERNFAMQRPGYGEASVHKRRCVVVQYHTLVCFRNLSVSITSFVLRFSSIKSRTTTTTHNETMKHHTIDSHIL